MNFPGPVTTGWEQQEGSVEALQLVHLAASAPNPDSRNVPVVVLKFDGRFGGGSRRGGGSLGGSLRGRSQFGKRLK